MIIVKVTGGTVYQKYDTKTKRFVSQRFEADTGSGSWESEEGKDAAWPNPVPYLTFDMVQPQKDPDSDPIQVQTRVRSFDFDSRDLTGPNACYVEGKVVGFAHMGGCERYAILVERRIVRGESRGGRGDMVYPPLNGTPTSLGNVTNCVEVIKEENNE